jgi:outer membrane protein TolC
VAIFLALAGTAIAQADKKQLELEPLVREALARNPEILSAQKRYEAANQRPVQESALPDPMFSAGWASVGNPLPGAGLGTEPVANIGAMVSQPLPYPGKRRLKAEAAEKEAAVEFQNYQAVQLNVVSRLKQAYYRLQHAWSMGRVLDRNRDVLTGILRVTEARYQVGRGMQQDVLKAQTQLSLLEARRLQLEREKRAREAEINSLLARPVGSPLAPPPEPQVHPGMHGTLDAVLAATQKNSPMIKRDQHEIEKSETGVRLARRDYFPDFTVNAGYYNMGAMPSMYEFRVDMNIPLRTRKRRAAVAEQQYTVEQARRSYAADAQSIAARIQDDWQMAETALKLVDLYDKTVLPQAYLTLQSSLASYQTGGVDFLSVLSNFAMVLEYEMNRHEEMQNYHVAESRIEEMAGISLDTLPMVPVAAAPEVNK